MAIHDNTLRVIHPMLATLLATVQEMPKEQLPALLGDLEQIRCLAMVRLMSAPGAPQEPEQVLDVTQVADRIHQSEDYVYRHQEELGGFKQGGSLRFLASRIDKRLRQQKGLTARRQRPILQLRRPS